MSMEKSIADKAADLLMQVSFAVRDSRGRLPGVIDLEETAVALREAAAAAGQVPQAGEVTELLSELKKLSAPGTYGAAIHAQAIDLLTAQAAEIERLNRHLGYDAETKGWLRGRIGEKVAAVAAKDAALRAAQEWLIRVTADTADAADYLNGDGRGRCGWDDGVDVLKKVSAGLAPAGKEVKP